MQELTDAARDRDSAVFGIQDLKKFFIWSLVAAVSIAGAAGQFFYAKLSANSDADGRRDIAIQKLQDSFEHSSQGAVKLQLGLDKQQEIGSQMLLELTKLAGKVASTEEITRNTQARLEVLTDYIRQNHNPKKEVLQDGDSVIIPRGGQR